MKYHIGQVKKELGLSQKDLAEFFGMSYNSYANSSAKTRYEIALCRFYECVLLGGKKNETKNLTDTDNIINDGSQPLILYGVSNMFCWVDGCNNKKMQGHLACEEHHKKVVRKT